ncbi:MAG: MBL fold metallo-hydrolase [Anaerolineae bacterium]|jgi:cyclase|nr:MBL fold metallo-hydrolase [Anaerolineae bacterium]
MIREIAPNVFVETEYHGANVAFIATGEGVILIDTPMLPREARHWLCEIEKRTDERILYIVNTDHHRAHIIGNQHFPMATVVAHENAWKEIKSYGDSFRTRLMNMYRERIPEAAAEWKQTLEIVKPQVTFTGRTVLYKGQTELHLIAVGGHTPATAVVYMPNEKLLFTGDVVVTNRPPFLSQGNTKEWLEALTYLRKLRYDILIPGHGELTGKEATDRMSEYLRLVRRKVRSAYQAGMPKADTARSLSHLIRYWPIPPFEKPKADRRFKSGLGRVWNEIKAEETAKAKAKTKAKARSKSAA